jgi:hypothetical protein
LGRVSRQNLAHPALRSLTDLSPVRANQSRSSDISSRNLVCLRRRMTFEHSSLDHIGPCGTLQILLAATQRPIIGQYQMERSARARTHSPDGEQDGIVLTRIGEGSLSTAMCLASVNLHSHSAFPGFDRNAGASSVPSATPAAIRLSRSRARSGRDSGFRGIDQTADLTAGARFDSLSGFRSPISRQAKPAMTQRNPERAKAGAYVPSSVLVTPAP